MMTKTTNILAKFIEVCILWLLGGSIYYSIELLYRGYSHFSMFIVGGVCFLIIGAINEIFSYDMLFQYQIILGDIIVLEVEFIAGLIVNVWLGLNVWDYSDMAFNIMGQICPQFAILWLPIVAFAIVLDDWIKYFFMGYKKPYYRFKKKGESN